MNELFPILSGLAVGTMLGLILRAVRRAGAGAQPTVGDLRVVVADSSVRLPS